MEIIVENVNKDRHSDVSLQGFTNIKRKHNPMSFSRHTAIEK